MKQIHKAVQVQALESDIGFSRPPWVLLKKLKNASKKQANSPGLICILKIFRNNPSRGFREVAETSCDGGGCRPYNELLEEWS